MLLVWNSRSCEYKFLSKARAQLKNFVNRDKYETAVRKHRKEANFFFPLAGNVKKQLWMIQRSLYSIVQSDFESNV